MPVETTGIVPLVRMEGSTNKDVEKGGCESGLDVEKSTSDPTTNDVSDVCFRLLQSGNANEFEISSADDIKK